jgi:diguanylate cyclase (GGDEF)-like protein/PAS domain S-box-containing protein
MKTVNQLRWTYLSGLVIFIGSTLALCGYMLSQTHQQAVNQGLNDSAAQARSFEIFLTQSLSVAELSIANTLADRETQASDSDLGKTFSRALRNAPYLRSLSLLDADGKILVSSNPRNVGLSVSTEHYLPQSAPSTELMRIGPAWAGRDFDTGHAANDPAPNESRGIGFIPVLRTVKNGPRTQTILAALNTEYFIGHLAQTRLADDGETTVLLYDGTLLIDANPDAPVGRQQPKLLAALQLAERESGAFERQLDNNEPALTAFHTSSQYPVVVVTQRLKADALQNWQRDAVGLSIVVVAALLLITAVAMAYYRRQGVLIKQRAKSFRLMSLNAKVFDASVEAILICDADNNIQSVNAAFTHITGFTADEVRGRNPRLLASGLQDPYFFAALWQQLLSNDFWQGELVNRHANGSTYTARMSITVSRDAAGNPQHFIGNIVDVTAVKRMEKELRQSEQQYRALFDNMQRGFALHEVVTDESGTPVNYRLLAANKAYSEITGFGARMIVGRLVTELFPRVREDKVDWIGIYGEVALSGVPHRMECYSEGLGKWFHVVAYRPMPRQFAVLVSDITERKINEEKLQLAASVFANSREGIMITSLDGTIIDVNDAFTTITGYSQEEVVGKTPRVLSSGRQTKAFYQALWQDLHSKGHWYGEVWNRRKSGDVYAEMQTISTVCDAEGRPQHFVALFSDVTASKEHEKKLLHIAHYDALTNLPNRVLLGDRLHQGMVQATRHGKKLAVAFLDLDAFKAVNDTHGHEVGDDLLVALSARMRQALREGDTLARIGGDEFVAVIGDLSDAAASLPLLNRLLSAAAQPVQVQGLELQLSASLGVTFFPQDDDVEADQLMRQADQAMYQAKIAGKNRYHIFDAEMDRSVRGQHESIERIRLALSQDEFVLYYQPKVNMRSGQFIGAEALIRWQHPEKGLLSPAVFLPVIEDHLLAIEVGEWVIETGLTQMAQWREAGLHLPISVNIGARQLQQANFTERLMAQLAAHPEINPNDLELEVLETSALEDIAGVSRVIQACRAIGVKFALDDFGTGYSSLTYLKRLPVTMLKIDQSFVRDMLDDPDDLAILQGVIGMASAFRREVIAEGVETVAHGALLLQLGCELAQGYGIARPMAANLIPGWAATWQPDAAWKNQAVVTKEALPLLFASAELRAWVAAVIEYLRGNGLALPVMSAHDCQLGLWINSDGLARYRWNPTYAEATATHQTLHDRAAEILAMHETGRPTQDLWPELFALRDALLAQLDTLIHESA